jgi:hypothetical protein
MKISEYDWLGNVISKRLLCFKGENRGSLLGTAWHIMDVKTGKDSISGWKVFDSCQATLKVCQAEPVAAFWDAAKNMGNTTTKLVTAVYRPRRR